MNSRRAPLMQVNVILTNEGSNVRPDSQREKGARDRAGHASGEDDQADPSSCIPEDGSHPFKMTRPWGIRTPSQHALCSPSGFRSVRDHD